MGSKMSSSNLGKLGGSGGDSRGSDASFEERLQRKAREGSVGGPRYPLPGKVASTPLTKRLDDLQARIEAKGKAEDMNTSSGSSSGKATRPRNPSPGACAPTSASRGLDDLEARIR